MRVEIKIIRDANVYETWEVNVPDGLAGDDLQEAALGALWGGNADLIEDEHDSECSRQIISVDILGPSCFRQRSHRPESRNQSVERRELSSTAQELLAIACRIQPASFDVCIGGATRRDPVPATVLENALGDDCLR